MKTLFQVAALLFVALPALAGDNGGGTMQCTSPSGRTQLTATGVADYNGSGNLAVKLTIDGKVLELGLAQKNTNPNVNATGATVFFPNSKVYTATISYVGEAGKFDYAVKVFELAAVPTSMKKGVGDQFTFDAVLRSIDPRLDQKDDPRFIDGDINVRCKMDLSI